MQCASREKGLCFEGEYAAVRRRICCASSENIACLLCRLRSKGRKTSQREANDRIQKKNASICANKNTFPFEVNEKKCKFVRG